MNPLDINLHLFLILSSYEWLNTKSTWHKGNKNVEVIEKKNKKESKY